MACSSSNRLNARLLRELRLSHAGWPQENETSDGTLWILEARAASQNRVGNRVDRLVLAYHTLVQMAGQRQDLFLFAFNQFANRNVRPARHDGRNVLLVHFFLEKAVAVAGLKPLFGVGKLAFELGNGAVPDLGRGVEIVGALRFFEFIFRLLELLPKLLETADLLFLGVPAKFEFGTFSP